jgi:hypothetical protein
MNFLEHNNAMVEYNEHLESMNISLHGTIPHEELRQISLIEYDLIRQHQIKKCMVNIQGIDFSSIKIQQYLQEDWFPQVAKYGMIQVAVVVSEKVYISLFGDRFYPYINDAGMVIQYFKDMSLANEWISG